VKDGRVHVNVEKSCFEHTCEEGDGGRKRKHNTTALIAAPSPVRRVMEKMSSSETLSSSIASTGLPPPSHKRAQNYVRRENSTSWHQYVAELHHLPSFFEALKVQDPRGTYICEMKPEVYNGEDVQVFQRYFVSWAAAKEVLLDTPLLYFIVIDGGHMKGAFGGVCLAAVVATANSKIFPAGWAVVDSENEPNCLWFFDHVLACFPGIEFVWMTDQGTALTAVTVAELLGSVDELQLQSLCAKHIIKTIEVAKTRGEIRGTLTGMREMVFRFARSRTRERGDEVLAEIERKNRDVANYLRERREKIEAASFLEPGRRRGGRITSQLVESFFNMVRIFRGLGLVDGIIWMCKKFQEIQLEEREAVKRWLSKDYKGLRIASLSHAASAKFFELVGWRTDDAFRVDELQRNDLELVGDVVKTADGSVRHIRISRPVIGGRMVIDCPCLTRQEFGFPCARAARLLIAGGWCVEGFPVGAVAEYLSARAWEMQAAVNVVVPAMPGWLVAFSKQGPAASLRALVKAEGALKLLPGRIPVPAGRPKLIKRPRKQFNSHFARIKSGTEKGDGKRKPKEIEIGEGDDLAIVKENDLDVPELPRNERSDGEDESDEESDEKSDDGLKEAGEVVPPPTEVQSFADFWLVGNDAGASKKVKESECSACGKAGHKWPKCRARNIELMLVSIGAMSNGQSEVLVASPPRPRRPVRVVEQSLVQAVMEADPAVPDGEPVAEKIAEKSRKGKKRLKVVTCMLCNGETLHENWRWFGLRCSCCQYSFAHLECVKAKKWTCMGCEAGSDVVE
jgi:hypothetical protein